ncbi:hypothetical protein DBR06_SOUSAS10510141, partial [Sousa chinensis]
MILINCKDHCRNLWLIIFSEIYLYIYFIILFISFFVLGFFFFSIWAGDNLVGMGIIYLIVSFLSINFFSGCLYSVILVKRKGQKSKKILQLIPST